MDIRQQVTDDIVAAMEKGTPPWHKGWAPNQLHFNASSGQEYKGINQVILGAQSHSDPRWMTCKQVDEIGGLQVRKGERGVRIVKLIQVDRKRAHCNDCAANIVAEERGQALIMKFFTVFNAGQIDGLAPMPDRERAPGLLPAERVEAVLFGLQDTGLRLNFMGSAPAYYPRTDEIRISVASTFHSLDDFHASLLHEATHASGHPKRLARLHLEAQSGSAEYAREELRAELATAIMTGIVGLPPGPSMIESHMAYLTRWLEALRRDKGEIFRAAADAQKICDYLSKCALSADMVHPERPVQEPGQERNMTCQPLI
jgi:antirestriction protein ArdC